MASTATKASSGKTKTGTGKGADKATTKGTTKATRSKPTTGRRGSGRGTTRS